MVCPVGKRRPHIHLQNVAHDGLGRVDRRAAHVVALRHRSRRVDEEEDDGHLLGLLVHQLTWRSSGHHRVSVKYRSAKA